MSNQFGVFRLYDIVCANCGKEQRERVQTGLGGKSGDRALHQAIEKGWTYDWRRFEKELLCPGCTEQNP